MSNDDNGADVGLSTDNGPTIEGRLRFDRAQLQTILNVLPAYTWYASPSGALIFVNKRTAEYLGVPEDHPLRLGIDIGAQWDDWIALLHPDDRDRSRKYWSDCLRTGEAGEHSYRVRDAQGAYRWFLTSFEPLRARDGSLLLWVGATLDIEELKCTEHAFRESEYKLRQIIETVPGLIWSAGPDGEPLHVNRRLLDYSGLRFENFKDRGWEAFVHPADLPETARAYYHAFQAGSSYQGVFRLRRADGEFRWHHARCEPLRDPQGRIIQWYGLSLDIDEAKKAEDRLRRSEAYLAEAQRIGHIGSAAYNDTAILYWSDETYRILEFDPLNGLPSREAVQRRTHPDDRERVREQVKQALRHKRDYKLEFRILLPAGRIKHIELIAHPKFSASGQLIEVVSTLMDVTERKCAEEALRESEGKFRDYAETASDWLWEMGPDYRLTFLTENAFGSGQPGRLGTVCWDHALDFATEPEKWRLLRTALDSRKSFRDFVYYTADAGGSPIHVRASGKPVFDAGGEFRGYRGTGSDVTTLMRAQRAEASLRAVQAELAHVSRVTTLGQLTASISHEVTQPISSARNNARAAMNFLNKQSPDLAEITQALESAVADIDRAGQILDRIRDQIKKAPPRRDRFDLNNAVNEVIALLQGEITNNRVSIQNRFAAGECLIEGDRIQLQQVVMNLILNAIEAMSGLESDARELSITIEQNLPNGVLVEVRDSGPGIEPESLGRLFEPFYTTKTSGVGMGLSISRSIIDAHGGRLWADAVDPRGTIFRFTLPIAERPFMRSPPEFYQSEELYAGTHSAPVRRKAS